MYMCGGPVLNAVYNPYRLYLKDITNPTTEKIEITTVLLNDLCEALFQGFPIDHVLASKQDLVAGYQLLKIFVNHKETLLAKTQEQLVKYQDFLSFVQGTEDENSIARTKDYLVAYITKIVIDKLTLKEIVVHISFPVKHLLDGVKKIIIAFLQGHTTRAPSNIFTGNTSKVSLLQIWNSSHIGQDNFL
jgi:hypothetical protein